MNPNNNDPVNVPSGPPPEQLPRPRLRNIDGFAPRQTPPSLAQPQTVARVTQPPSTSGGAYNQAQSLPVAAHPAEHLLPAPHEPLLGPGSAAKTQKPAKKKWSLKKKILAVIVALLVLVVAVGGAVVAYYNVQLQPVSSNDKHVRVTIASGTSPAKIGEQLQSAGLVRSEWVFTVYTYLSHTRDDLKAGTYNLLPSQSLPDIVSHLVSGKQDEFSMTFLPGDTLDNHRKRLLEAGYSTTDIDQALAATYPETIFSSKPSTADLEGYIYGQTYSFDATATAKDVLKRTFDEFEKQATTSKLAEGFKQQGLTFYEGITLASIIQREVSNPADEKQVAQVFYSRMKSGMTLGSDVTYQYAAKKLGVAPDPTLDSPYNTRKYPGLPPGPIASPGLSALQAAAYPAAGNYLYFLSGDDDKTYFATTNEGHEQNVVAHCQKKCLIN